MSNKVELLMKDLERRGRQAGRRVSRAGRRAERRIVQAARRAENAVLNGCGCASCSDGGPCCSDKPSNPDPDLNAPVLVYGKPKVYATSKPAPVTIRPASVGGAPVRYYRNVINNAGQSMVQFSNSNTNAMDAGRLYKETQEVKNFVSKKYVSVQQFSDGRVVGEDNFGGMSQIPASAAMASVQVSTNALKNAKWVPLLAAQPSTGAVTTSSGMVSSGLPGESEPVEMVVAKGIVVPALPGTRSEFNGVEFLPTKGASSPGESFVYTINTGYDGVLEFFKLLEEGRVVGPLLQTSNGGLSAVVSLAVQDGAQVIPEDARESYAVWTFPSSKATKLNATARSAAKYTGQTINLEDQYVGSQGNVGQASMASSTLTSGSGSAQNPCKNWQDLDRSKFNALYQSCAQKYLDGKIDVNGDPTKVAGQAPMASNTLTSKPSTRRCEGEIPGTEIPCDHCINFQDFEEGSKKLNLCTELFLSGKVDFDGYPTEP